MTSMIREHINFGGGTRAQELGSYHDFYTGAGSIDPRRGASGRPWLLPGLCYGGSQAGRGGPLGSSLQPSIRPAMDDRLRSAFSVVLGCCAGRRRSRASRTHELASELPRLSLSRAKRIYFLSARERRLVLIAARLPSAWP